MPGPVEPDLRAIAALGQADPALAPAAAELADATRLLVGVLAAGGTVFLAGNGGSMADALHIAGELRKSFERPRPLPADLATRLAAAGGAELAEHLQAGLRVQVLGADPVLASAVDNDLAPRHLGFAQDLVALARPGDALVVLTTSGRSPNVRNAVAVARALGLPVVALTGDQPAPGLEEAADVVVHAPAAGTAAVQTSHSVLYHALCRSLEDTFFPPSPAAPTPTD